MTEKQEYILKSDAIKAIQNDCLECVYYTKEDAIAAIESCETTNLIKLGIKRVSDNSGNYCAQYYRTTKSE